MKFPFFIISAAIELNGTIKTHVTLIKKNRRNK